MELIRSWMFVPGHRQRMIDKALGLNADAIMLDIEDGVAPNEKDTARKNIAEGVKEMIRSASKAAFVRSLQRLIPEIQAEDIVPAHAGVRAQALKSDGALVDDFMIVPGPNALHICNAPSPAATASLEIGQAIVDRIPA